MDVSGSSSGSLVSRFRNHLAENESSDRGFGLLVSLVFLLIGLRPMLQGAAPRYWSLIGALDLLVLSLIFPRTLRSIKHAWLFLGFLLATVVNPLVLALLFHFVITPAALVLRMFGADPLRLRLDPNLASYWQSRSEPGTRFQDQF